MINVRNYKQFQVDQFRADITAAPFHVARVFEDKDDVLWAWNKYSKIFVTYMHLQGKLKAIKPNKSAGPDDIAPKLLKLAEPAIVSPLTGLFSFCAHLRETSTDWKKGRLIPVYKKDDEADTNNYRPIRLLSVPSKIMESCVSESVVLCMNNFLFLFLYFK